MLIKCESGPMVPELRAQIARAMELTTVRNHGARATRSIQHRGSVDTGSTSAGTGTKLSCVMFRTWCPRVNFE